jgi:WD40 repeat protein/class 3 adenylate cyclase
MTAMNVERAAAPGVLAFLIADIRGWTAFTQAHGDEAAGRLASTFADIARQGIEAGGGELLELRGDEAMAVFTSVRGCLRTAAALQTVFADETRLHPELPLTVGMGIDAGEAVPVEGGYRGGALNLAARLCSLAKAGDVLASEGVVHLARAVDGVQITEWGTAQVKGIAEPVRAYAVTTPGAAVDLVRRPDELPAELDSFTPMVGRERELRRLAWAWRTARQGHLEVAVVRGPAGIGKTRLLAGLAAAVRDGGGNCRYLSLAARQADPAAWFGELAGPCVAVVDDVDGATPEALVALLDQQERLAGRPVLLAVAVDDDHASDDAVRAVARLDDSASLSLPPLDLAQMREVAALYLPGIADQIPVDVLTATGGIPRALHRSVSEWAAAEASRRLGTLATRAASGRHDLASLESDLAGTVVDLQQVRERARLFGLRPGRHETFEDHPPYQGLASFDVDDAPLFFGRERLVADLIARLAGASLVGVVGSSGSGKSSAVRAGLLPALAAGVLPGSAEWITVAMRPGEHPMRALDLAVIPALPPEVGRHLPGRSSLLVEVSAALPADRRLVIVVDQFEEVFTQTVDETDRNQFLTALADATALPGGRVVSVLAIRADYYGRFAAAPELAGPLAANHVLVGPMTAEEYRRAIVNPALRYGVTVEPDLVELLVNDVLGEPGALPLLSTTLLELWEQRSGRTLTAAAYAASGGVRGAVARLAEQVYAEFGEVEQVQVRRVMLRLAGPGEGDGVVRRRAPLAEFDPDHDAVATHVIETMARRRLLTVTNGYVEVAHEALLREWPRFRGWLEEDREGLRLRAHLAQATQEWITAGRDPAELYRGARLSAALDWTTRHTHDLNEVEREFVQSSRADAQDILAHQQQQNRRLRGLLAGVALLLVVAVIAGTVALVQRSSARHNATVALARSLGAAAVSAPRIDQAMLLARQAVSVDQSTATESTLLSTLERSPALVGTLSTPIGWRPLRVALSPDGRLLAVDDNHETVRFYDTATRRQVMHTVPEAFFNGAWVGHDYVAGDGSDIPPLHYQWNVYDAASGLRRVGVLHPSGLFQKHSGNNSPIFASPDGTKFFCAWYRSNPSGSFGRTYLDAWDLATGRRREISLPAHGVIDARWTGRGRITVLTAARAFTVSAHRLRVVHTVPEHLSVQTYGVLSPDGRTAAFSPFDTSDPDTFSRLTLATARVTPAHGGSDQPIDTLGYTPDGRQIVTTSAGGDTAIWDSRTLTPQQTLAGDSGNVVAQTMSRNGRTLITASLDGAVFEWDLGAARRFGRPFLLGRAPLTDGGVQMTPTLAVSPDGRSFVAADGTGSARVLSTATLAREATMPGGRVSAADWSHTGQIATAGVDGVVRLSQGPDAQRPTAGLKVSGGVPVAVAISPDGRLVAAVTDTQSQFGFAPREDGWLDVWDAGTGQRVIDRHLHVGGTAVKFSPDGRTLAVGLDTDRVLLIDPESGRQPRSITSGPASDAVSALGFMTGTELLVGGFDGAVRRWDPSTGREIGQPVLVEPAPVASITVDPGGRRFATTGGSNGAVTLWDDRTLTQIGSAFPGGAGTWGAAQFTPDHDQLVALYSDGTGTVWPTSPGAWTAHACSVAGRNFTAEEWRRFVTGEPYERTCPQYPRGSG